MLKRALLIGGATAIAAAVLLVTLLAGPSVAPVTNHRATPPGMVDLPTGSDAPMGDLDENLPLRGTSYGQYAFQHGDRWTYLQFTEVTPLPEGMIDVVKPRARTHFSPSRVMEMTADQGTFFAPDNQPRKGDFRGNVVLTLYESPDGSPVDFNDPGHVSLVVYLDKASFDLELGQVDSAGPVHLTGPTVDFHGTGLSLNYNPRRERLERLEVFHGKSLRFRGPRDDSKATGAAPHADSPPRTAMSDQGPGAAPADPEPGPDAPAAAPAAPDAPAVPGSPDAAPPQYYRARFTDDVRIDAPGEVDAAGDDVAMTGDTLTALFSFGDAADDADQAAAGPSGPDQPQPPSKPEDAAADDAGEQVAAADVAQADAATAAPPLEGRSLMPRRADDVVITWTGPLLVEPEAEKPADLAGPDDALLGLEGKPVQIHTGRDETIIAQQVDYLLSSRRVRAVSRGDDDAIVLTSPRIGILTGSELAIDQAAGVGYVLGPGWLKGDPPMPDAAPPHADDDTAPDSSTRLAGGIEVTWTDRLDLTFYPSAAPDEQPSLTGLRTAVFRGDAVAMHPRFNLRGDELTIRATRPADDQPQSAEQIEAQGHVTLAARSDDGEDRIDLTSDHLSIDLAPAQADELRPTRIVAAGDVQVIQPNSRLRAQHLDITPAPPAPAGAPQAAATIEAVPSPPAAAPAGNPPAGEPAPPTDPALGIAHMIATDQVELHLADRDLTLIGEKLVVDTPADRIDLFGEDDQPARVVQADGTLTGAHIIVGQTRQTVDIAGPGAIDLDTLPDNPDGAMHITWRSAMHFDNRLGTAEFVDDIVATTSSPTDRTRLTADHLQLELAPEATEPANAPAGSTAPASDAPPPADTNRLRTATARGDAVFTAHSFDPRQPDGFLTHVRLEGPVMTFDRRPPTRQLQVLGAGRMLLIDRRPASSPTSSEALNRPAAPAPDPIEVTGRGATLFLWTDTLTLDAARHDMLLTGDVKMTHRPAPAPGPTPADTPSPTPIHFDAQRLLVDFQEGSSASAGEADAVSHADPASTPWLAGDMAGLTIREIQAHRGVLITRTPYHVIADHLHYAAATDTVVLTADPGRLVEVTQEDKPVPATGRVISWNLATRTIDVKDAGPTIVPLEAR